MIDKVRAESCTLCGSCYNACPVDAIAFDAPYFDFHYPRIRADRCIGCNRCEKACPVLAEKHGPEAGYPLAFAARIKEDPVRARSSSGGIFYALASQTLQAGGFVCGAVFDETFHVRHLVSNSPEDLSRMMGSKYAQSDMGLCFREIRERLEAGKAVLFSGCPCQVAGLRAFLGRPYDKLLLVELICHGIPSGTMLQAYISTQEKRYGAKLREMEFRNKDKGWHGSAVRMRFENGREYRCAYTEDAYMSGFLGNVFLKSSCFSCNFRELSAGSDLVLGDFWGAEAVMPEMDDNRGLSAVLINTAKGRRAWERLDTVASRPCEVETVIRYNQNLVRSAEPSPKRTAFYEYAGRRGYGAAFHKYLTERTPARLKRQSRQLLRRMWYRVRGKKPPVY